MLANPIYHKKHPQQKLGYLVLVSAVLLLTLVVGLVCAWLMLQTVASYYANRIYPNVYVLGLKLGRLTREEALALLDDAAPQADTGLLVLRDGENRWSVPWSKAGMQLDGEATVQAALTIGHSDAQGWRDQVRDWLARHDVAPVFYVDPQSARQLLEELAASVARPSINATVHLPQNKDEPIIPVPGQPGRELDIDATLTQLLTIANGENNDKQLDLVFQAVPPEYADANPLVAEIEELLSRRVELTTYDVLTDETISWTLDRDAIITWLSVAPSFDGPTVLVDQEAVRATLADLSAELGSGRGFRPEATEQVLGAFKAGGGAVTLYLTHPTRTHTVQPGDSLSSIAAAFGMTAWHLLRANPDVDPNWLHVGQELSIPSQDELTPNLPIPNKRIVVSIAEQRVRAYQGGELVHDWPVSTGIAESPTHTGVFQILSKEEIAYASLWDLWMPHFMAIYAAGPDFYNGLHGLPTLSSGRRLWEGLLGSRVSYGCIILGLEEAETLYQWAEVGVTVVVE